MLLAKSIMLKRKSVSGVIGLINNNCWGFAELIKIFGKENEYAHMFNYTSLAGDHSERKVAPGKIDIGSGGTVWQYPYLAWWIHQWTSNAISEFIDKTNGLALQQVLPSVHYSIGCIYFEKEYWLSMEPQRFKSTFDELLLHKYCEQDQKEKWVVMDEPMIHLFYRTQRQANQVILKDILPELAKHFNDETFKKIEPLSPDDTVVCIEEALAGVKTQVSYIHKKAAAFSFMKNWKEKLKRKKLMHNA